MASAGMMAGIGALTGGLEAYQRQIQTDMLEESELRRTENLNRLSRENKRLSSGSGLVDSNGREASVEEASKSRDGLEPLHDFTSRKMEEDTRAGEALRRELYKGSPEEAAAEQKIQYDIFKYASNLVKDMPTGTKKERRDKNKAYQNAYRMAEVALGYREAPSEAVQKEADALSESADFLSIINKGTGKPTQGTKMAVPFAQEGFNTGATLPVGGPMSALTGKPIRKK